MFNRTLNIKDLDFKVAFRTIRDIALIWYVTLLQLLGNQRAYRVSYQVGGQKIGGQKAGGQKAGGQKVGGQKAKSQDALVRQAYAIISIICSSRAKKRSNFFTLLMDIYLIGFRVKRRVFKTLFNFGLCYSYYLVNRIINSITKEAEVC